MKSHRRFLCKTLFYNIFQIRKCAGTNKQNIFRIDRCQRNHRVLAVRSDRNFHFASFQKFEHDEDILSKVTVEDLRKFGMIPEFLGRMPIIFTLKGLDKDMLVKILKEPRNAI